MQTETCEVYHKKDYQKILRDYFSEGSVRSFAKNAVIMSSEQAATEMFYIKSGAVRIYSNGRGCEFTHVIYAPGEMFPLHWLAEGGKQDNTYEALMPTELCCLSLTQIDKDLASNGALANAMLRQTVEQYRVYAMRVANLEYKYASERVAYRLLLLANRFGIRDGQQISIALPITHQLLATSLNLSRESVSREMEKLMQRGLVSYSGGRQIVLTDPAALSAQLRVPLGPELL